MVRPRNFDLVKPISWVGQTISGLSQLCCLNHLGLEEHLIFGETVTSSRKFSCLATPQFYNTEERLRYINSLFRDATLSSTLGIELLSSPTGPYFYVIADVHDRELCYQHSRCNLGYSQKLCVAS